MLKKIGSIASAVLLLAMFLVGCTIPSDISFTSSESYPDIQGVSNIQARAYDHGVIQVSWDVAKDAKSYDVYRRTYDDQKEIYENKRITNPAFPLTDAFINDVVSFDNQLQNDVGYEYTIVALSGQSTGTEIGTVVLNSLEKSNRVVAKVPARGSPLPTPTVQLETFSNFEYDGMGTLLASWEKEPGIQYELTYQYKSPDALNPSRFVYLSAPDTGALAPLGYWRVPNLSFDNYQNNPAKVEVRAIFETDYYKPSPIGTAEFKEVPEVRPMYAGNPAFHAGVKAVYDSIKEYPSGNYVDLTWEKQPDVAETNPYVLWKAEANSAGNIISDWATLTTTSQEEFFETAGGVTKVKLRVKDGAVEVGKFYAYILVVTGKNNGKRADQQGPFQINYHPSAGEPEEFIQSMSTDMLYFAPTTTRTGVVVEWLMKGQRLKNNSSLVAGTGKAEGSTYVSPIGDDPRFSLDQGDYNVVYKLSRAEVEVADITKVQSGLEPAFSYYELDDTWYNKPGLDLRLGEAYRNGNTPNNIKVVTGAWTPLNGGNVIKPVDAKNVRIGDYQATYSDAVTYPESPQAMPTIRGTTEVFFVDSSIPVQTTKKYYAYKLEAFKADKDGNYTIAAKQVIRIVNVSPYIGAVYVHADRNESGGDKVSDPGAGVSVNIVVPIDEDITDMTSVNPNNYIDIWRRTSAGGTVNQGVFASLGVKLKYSNFRKASEVFEAGTTFPFNGVSANDLVYVYQDPGVVRDVTYEYEAVVYRGGILLNKGRMASVKAQSGLNWLWRSSAILDASNPINNGNTDPAGNVQVTFFNGYYRDNSGTLITAIPPNGNPTADIRYTSGTTTDGTIGNSARRNYIRSLGTFDPNSGIQMTSINTWDQNHTHGYGTTSPYGIVKTTNGSQEVITFTRLDGGHNLADAYLYVWFSTTKTPTQNGLTVRKIQLRKIPNIIIEGNSVSTVQGTFTVPQILGTGTKYYVGYGWSSKDWADKALNEAFTLFSQRDDYHDLDGTDIVGVEFTYH